MKMKLAKEEVLVTVLNTKLLKETIAFFEGTQKELWTEKYGFNYEGEVLERFLERNLANTLEDVRAFILGACFTFNKEYEFYGEQRKNLGQVVFSKKEYQSDGILNFLIQVWNSLLEKKNFVENSFVTKLKNSNERIFILDFLEKNHLFFQDELPKELLFEIVKTVSIEELNKKEIHNKSKFDFVLASIYEVLRPKKGEFKNYESMFSYLQSIWRLSKNELKIDVLDKYWTSFVVDYAKALNCSNKEVVLLNFLLVNEEASWSKMSKVGKQRLFNEYLKIQLIDEENLPKETKDQMRTVKNNANEEELNIFDIAQWIHLISNETNLKFVIDVSNKLEKFPVATAILSMLNHSMFDKEIGERFVEKAIRSELTLFGENPMSWRTILKSTDSDYVGDTKYNIWSLVEQKRKEWKVSVYFSDSAAEYVELLLSLGIYSVENTQEIFENGLKDVYLKYVKGMKEKDEWLNVLRFLPVEERGFILEDSRYYSYNKKINFDRDVFNKVNNKSLYVELFFETLYCHSPEKYADEIFNLFNNEYLFKQSGLVENEVLDLLKYAYDNDLFATQQIRESVKEKFMTEEEKEIQRKNEFLQKMNRYEPTTRHAVHLLKELESYIKFTDVKVEFVKFFKSMEFKFEDDVFQLFTWLKKEELENNFDQEQLKTFSSKLNDLIEKNVKGLSENKLRYYLYVRSLLSSKKAEVEIEIVNA